MLFVSLLEQGKTGRGVVRICLWIRHWLCALAGISCLLVLPLYPKQVLNLSLLYTCVRFGCNNSLCYVMLQLPSRIYTGLMTSDRIQHADIDVSFVHAFVASLSVIIISEIGDKTFFIAAIMAMTHSRLTVFAGAIAALGLMTVLSGLF